MPNEPTPPACTNCNGKGYNTRCYDEVGSDDFGGEGYARRGLIQRVPCKKCAAPTQDKQSDFVDPNGNHIVPDVGPLAEKQCTSQTPPEHGHDLAGRLYVEGRRQDSVVVQELCASIRSLQSSLAAKTEECRKRTEDAERMARMAFGYFFTLGKWAKEELPTSEIDEAIAKFFPSQQ